MGLGTPQGSEARGGVPVSQGMQDHGASQTEPLGALVSMPGSWAILLTLLVEARSPSLAVRAGHRLAVFPFLYPSTGTTGVHNAKLSSFSMFFFFFILCN